MFQFCNPSTDKLYFSFAPAFPYRIVRSGQPSVHNVLSVRGFHMNENFDDLWMFFAHSLFDGAGDRVARLNLYPGIHLQVEVHFLEIAHPAYAKVVVGNRSGSR